MSKTRFYHACSLSKGNVHTRTHLPEKYAKLGLVVDLRDEDDRWDRGWTVKSVGDPIPAEYAEAYERAWKDIWKPSTQLTERGKK